MVYNLSTVSAWDSAVASWASAENCQSILTNDTSEFARIWIYCITLALVLLVLVLVPYAFLGFYSADEFEGSEEKVYEAATSSLKTTPKAESKTNPSRLASALTDASEDLDFDAARRNLLETSALDENSKVRPIWGTKISDMRYVGGVGMELYFRLLVSLGLCFTVISLINLPALIFNSLGSFAPDAGSVGVRTTIGNLGHPAIAAGYPQDMRQVIVSCQAQDITKMTPVFAWLDFVSMFFLLALVAYFRLRTVTRLEHVVNTTTVTCSDFTLEIYDLPEMLEEGKHEKYEQLLKEFVAETLSRLKGEDIEVTRRSVREVTLAREYSQHLGTLRERAELRFRRTVAEQTGDAGKAAKYQKRIDDYTRYLEKTKDGAIREIERPVRRAFVTLHTTSDVHRFLEAFRYTQFTLLRALLSVLPCFSHHRFEGRTIRVRVPDEPTNILWVNLDTSRVGRILRWVTAMVGWIVIMAVAIFILYGLQVLIADNGDFKNLGGSKCGQLNENSTQELVSMFNSENSNFVCDPIEAKQLTIEEGKLLKETAAVECFCSAKGHTMIAKTAELRSVCQDWIVQQTADISFMIICSSLVVIINYAMLRLLGMICVWQRPTSVSSLETSVMAKCSVAQILNTGFVVFFANYSGLFIFDGHFDDFSPGWYAIVGRQIIQVMGMNVVSTAACYAGFWFITVLRRRCCANRCKHQVELIELYTNAPFELSGRLSVVIMTVFCTMTFSPGMPILYLLAVAFFFVMYWADKIILLKGSCQPPMYDGSSTKLASSLLLICIPVHCAFAIMMFGQPCVFPSSQQDGQIAEWKTQASSTADVSYGFIPRLSREATWMFTAVFAIFIVTTLLGFLLYVAGNAVKNSLQCCKFVFRCCWCCCGADTKVIPSDVADTMSWDDARKLIETVAPPASYMLERSPDFEPYFSFMWSDDGLGEGGEVPEKEDIGAHHDIEKGTDIGPTVVGSPSVDEAPVLAMSPPASASTRSSDDIGSQHKECEQPAVLPIESMPLVSPSILDAFSHKDEEAEEEDC
eukprot:TRINITY_DN30232_c1_g1_i1.p1 TRINITY_DN30232_c1_g1~~TRINITY_DN30232_c1_g1_i1.p1  ORF type:complete len:1071 (-),score=130.00 TRINITY_DN30232_c1_g1_i1:162-3251(-)